MDKSKLIKSVRIVMTSSSANTVLLALLAFFLLFWKSPHSGFGDDGIYVSAGQRVLNGSPIYIQGFRSGPFGAIVLHAIAETLPQNLGWLIFQVIYLLCIVGVVSILINGSTKSEKILVMVFAISSAPMRESLHNHQITALVVFLAIWPFFYFDKNLFVKFFAILSCSMAMDLKPQIAIFLILALTLINRNFLLPLLSTLFTIFSHGIISIYRGEYVDIQWINFLLSLSRSNKWGESIFFWPLLEKLGLSSEFLFIAQQTLILGLFLFIVYSGVTGRATLSLVAVGFLTYCMSYSHFYDCILIAVFAIIKSVVNPSLKTLLFMGYAIVPGEIFTLQNLVFFFFMMSFYLLNVNSSQVFRLTNIFFASLILLIIQLVNNFTFSNSEDQVRLRSAIYISLALLVCVDLSRIKIRFAKVRNREMNF